MSILTSEAFVEISVFIILLLSLGLTIVMTKRYLKSRIRPLLFWSGGMWFFTLGVLIELIFSFGYYNILVGDLYLLFVSIIVEMLAMGSVQLLKSRKASISYGAFMFASTAILLASLLTSNIKDIVEHYIVFSVLPLTVVLSSSLVTFPAAILLIAIAVVSYRKKKSYKMISIIIGVLVVSVAGTLYIAEIPVFLYYSEFIGILLLWYGFI